MPGADLERQMAAAPDLAAGIDPATAEKQAQEVRALDAWFAERLGVFTSSGLSAERFGRVVLLRCRSCMEETWEVPIEKAMEPASRLCPRKCNAHNVDADLDMHGR
jgi:hypothetical protein